MRISKPIRQLLYLLVPLGVGGSLAAATLSSLGWPALCFLVLAFPPSSLLLTLPIDALDHWLRRRSCDPIWLLSVEGKAWLESEEGRSWSAAQGARDA